MLRGELDHALDILDAGVDLGIAKRGIRFSSWNAVTALSVPLAVALPSSGRDTVQVPGQLRPEEVRS
jgi:hypothetical protein